MKKIRCSIAYHRIGVTQLDGFALGVRDGIYGNAATFATPPLTLAEFELLITDQSNTRAAYENGGSAQKGPYQAARQALMVGLDTLSNYVNTVADGDENIVLLSGFVPTKGSSSKIPKPVEVTGVTIKRGSKGEFFAECDTQAGVVSYGCIVSAGQPLSSEIEINEGGQLTVPKSEPTEGKAEGDIFDFGIKRRKTFINLTPGITYYFVFYAANAEGVGPLSRPVSLMCA